MTNRGSLGWSALSVLAVIALVPAASVYYESRGGVSGSPGCTRCHEIVPTYSTWNVSTHRKIACAACHGDAATLDVGFHLNNLKRVAEHFSGRVPDQIRMRAVDVPAMLQRCRSCHRQEFADWEAGPHGVTYAKIFLNAEENSKKAPMDDCLRCHGAHFAGGIRDLVAAPVGKGGAWKMAPGMENQPAIPCLACHQMHHEGVPLERAGAVTEPAKEKPPARTGEMARPSVAMFDRRMMMHVSLARLPMPEMREGERLVKMSPDPRQALCYQCHASQGGSLQAGKGDDRTTLGVHEGLSCLACHFKHGMKTRASCVECHPRWSNCGLDVEKMDTTYFDPRSKHNIHFVKCADCHRKGVPERRAKR